jgi:hypothetical protein
MVRFGGGAGQSIDPQSVYTNVPVRKNSRVRTGVEGFKSSMSKRREAIDEPSHKEFPLLLTTITTLLTRTGPGVRN